MKKRYYIALGFGLLLFISGNLAAQSPTLTTAGTPVAGSSANLFSTATNTVTNPGASGANITWNFGDITPSGSQKIDFDNAAATPYGAQFPNTIAVIYSENLSMPSATLSHEFWNTQGGTLNRKGVANPLGITVDYADSKQMLSLPFTYNSNFTDNFSANYVAQGTNVSETGQRTVTADGYGTLVLPYGTVSNVLRVHTTETYQQVIPSLPNPLNYTVETYAWYRSDWNFPVMVISTESIDVSPQPVSVAYYTQYISTGQQNVELAQFALRSYPNPASSQATIEFSLPQTVSVALNLYSINGQLLDTVLSGEQMASGKQSANLDVSAYPAGVYLAELVVDGARQVHKLVVK